MIANIKYRHIILALTGILTLMVGVLTIIRPSAIFPDPSWGFQVMRGMQAGGGFNMLPGPSMADISKDNPSFLSWWSPGQYLAPYFFIKLLGLNIGQANALVAMLCSLIGLAGFYACFKKLGFSVNIAAISVAFIACQQAYFVPFVFYNGGEVLLFAFAGWFLYGCTAFNKVGWQAMLFLFASGIIGFFCKSAFLWIFFSGGLYLWIRLSQGNQIKTWLVNGISIGTPAALSLVVIYLTYLSKGENPASEGGALKLAWETFTFPIASPLLAGFSVDDLSNGLVMHSGPAVFNPACTVMVLLLLSLLCLFIAFCIYRYTPYQNYKLLFLIFYVVAILFFGITFLRQANISYESRHLRLIGLIVTPGIIYLTARLKMPYQVIFGLIWLFIAYTSYQSWLVGYHRHKYEAVHGSTGIAQLFINAETLQHITRLDAQHRDAVFVFISPDLGLEIKHNRIITFDPIDDALTGHEDFYKYAGHAGPVYIMLPKAYMGAKAAVYMKSFTGYGDFVVDYEDKGYVVYVGR